MTDVIVKIGTGYVGACLQNKIFYALGRWWVWYADGTNFGWKTSADDGANWSSFSNYGPYFSWQCDVWFDEPNNKVCVIHLVSGGVGDTYQEGTLNANGTISWDSVRALGGYNTEVPSLCKDSEGYPWYSYSEGGYGTHSYIRKATAKNGSSWDAPIQLFSKLSQYNTVQIIPLTNGKLLAVLANYTQPFKSRLFNGTAWESEVDASTHALSGETNFKLIPDGDNAHLIFRRSDYRYYIKYSYGVGWGSEEVYQKYSDAEDPVITLKGPNDVRVYFFGWYGSPIYHSTTLLYRDRTAGVWSDETLVYDAGTQRMRQMTCPFKIYNDHYTLMFNYKNSLPYDVMFLGQTLPSTIPTVATHDATDILFHSATLNGEITNTGGENCDERGFDWGIESGVYTHSWTETDSYGIGVFNHNITGLLNGTKYYFRAKAHNSVGWGYGTELSFIVLEYNTISWSEGQSCDPAMREIPLSSDGELVDTGTFVIDNRILTFTVRLTDAQKDALNTIFNDNAIVTIMQRIESGFDYPRWIYTGWFSRILKEYRYSKEGSDEREWEVELEFYCSSFSYEVSP
jgi:hypothetical protein